MNETLGNRLLHVTIDEKAKCTPDKVWASMPKNSDISHGFLDITFSTLANAINRLSWFLKEEIGTSSVFETVLYIGPPDIRYQIVAFALNKTGRKGLFSAPRNSSAGHLELMDKTSCKAVLYGEGYEEVAKALASARSLPSVRIAPLSSFLDATKVEHYPAFRETMDESRWDPFVVVHTSGSTGLPKPVVITNEYLSRQDQLFSVPKSDRISVQELFRMPGRTLSSFPPFHVGGLVLLGPVLSIFGDTTLVWGPADRPLTADVAIEMITYGNIERAVLTTGLIDAMATNTEAVTALATLSHVGYAGGPLHPELGAHVAKSIRHLFSFFGSTETGMVIQYLNDPEDWEWLDFSSPLNGMDMVEINPGIYENVIRKDERLCAYQGAFGTFPELSEWRSRDMWRRHPRKSGLYIHVGRLDDLIIYCNGSKWNPLGSEGILKMHDMVSSAMIVGTGRNSPAVVVDLHHKYQNRITASEREQILDHIWLTVERANIIAPTNGQIRRSMVIFSKHEKPFMKTGKGTLMRALTTELYKPELDDLYTNNMVKRRSPIVKPGMKFPWGRVHMGGVLRWPLWLLSFLFSWFFRRGSS